MKPAARRPRIAVPAEAVRTREQVLAAPGLVLRGETVWATCWNCGGTGNYPSSLTPPGRCRLYCWTGRDDTTYGRLPIPVDRYVKKAQAADRANYRAGVRARQFEAQRDARLADAPDPRLLPLLQAFGLDPRNLPSLETEPEGVPATRWFALATSLVAQWVAKGELSEKQWDLAAKLPGYEAERVARAQAEADARAASQHVGTAGQRLVTTVTVEALQTFPSALRFGGVRTRVRMRDTHGNVVVWWTSSVEPKELVKGATVTVKATVKRHVEYKGERQTEVLRLVVTPPVLV